MAVETTRDIVIIISGILFIILSISLLIALLIAYLKIRKLTNKANKYVVLIRRWLAYVSGAIKGLNESLKIFGKGG